MALFTVMIFGYGSKTPPAPYILATLLLVVIGMGSQVYRYRGVADGVQRQQTKWVLFAIIVTVCFLVILTLPLAWSGALEPDSPLAPLFLWLIAADNLITSLLPLSIGLAILRYRLWDIDVIIRRTLVWTALTVLLGLVYFGGVTLLQTVFSAVSRQQSPVAIVLSPGHCCPVQPAAQAGAGVRGPAFLPAQVQRRAGPGLLQRPGAGGSGPGGDQRASAGGSTRDGTAGARQPVA